MLSPDPKKRCSSKEALNHVWFHEDQKIIKSLLTLNKMIANKSESNSIDINGMKSNPFSFNRQCFKFPGSPTPSSSL